MASSSIANLISFFTPAKPPPPPPLKTPLLQLSTVSSSSETSLPTSSSLRTKDGLAQLPSLSCSSSSSDNVLMSVVCPALAYANTLFFRSAYNVQVIVDDNEPEEKLLNRFRREVMRAGVIQECRRRRFFENKQDEKKRRTREAAKRNRRRRPQSRGSFQDKQETYKNKKEDEHEDQDNWELPVGDLPY